MYEQREVDGHDTGAMWECPFLAPLDTCQSAAPPSRGHGGVEPNAAATSAGPPRPDEHGAAAAAARTHVLCISPYPHRGHGTNSCLYWLGQYHDARFDIDAADGASAVCRSFPSTLCLRSFDGTVP